MGLLVTLYNNTCACAVKPNVLNGFETADQVLGGGRRAELARRLRHRRQRLLLRRPLQVSSLHALCSITEDAK